MRVLGSCEAIRTNLRAQNYANVSKQNQITAARTRKTLSHPMFCITNLDLNQMSKLIIVIRNLNILAHVGNYCFELRNMNFSRFLIHFESPLL